jgi:hypothetical protein
MVIVSRGAVRSFKTTDNAGNYYLLIDLYPFLGAFFAVAFFAGRLFPKDPLKRFPLAVFLSPLPIMFFLMFTAKVGVIIKKLRPASAKGSF